MLTKPRLALAVSAVLLVGLVAPAGALAGDLDQQQSNSETSNGIGTGQSLAQTVAAGRSGLLDRVDLGLLRSGSPPSPVTVELRNVSAGAPGTQVLASASIPEASVPTTAAFVSAIFPAPASVTAGTQYAIVAYADSFAGNVYSWADKPGNPYSGGAEFRSAATPPSTTWIDNSPLDTAFRTWVVPSASSASIPTGERPAALMKCKKRRTAKARKHCRKRAKKLPL